MGYRMLRGKQGFATLDFDGIVEEDEESPNDPSRKEPTSASGFPPSIPSIIEQKIVYIDMDNVLVDFKHALGERGLDPDMNDADEIGGIFSEMIPMKGAVDAFHALIASDKYDLYILSTAPWKNPSAWYDKVQWVKRYLGPAAKKRLILSHNKNLNRGTYLIDDRPNNGAKEFGEIEGQTWIHFGTEQFPDWDAVLSFLDV
jgi:5'(3')-deoxyribonucleotidase